MVAWVEGYGKGWMEELQKGREETFEMMDMFIILIVVIVSQVYAYIKSYTLYSLLHVNKPKKEEKGCGKFKKNFLSPFLLGEF